MHMLNKKPLTDLLVLTVLQMPMAFRLWNWREAEVWIRFCQNLHDAYTTVCICIKWC